MKINILTTILLATNNVRLKQTESEYLALKSVLRDRGDDIRFEAPNSNGEEIQVLRAAVGAILSSVITETLEPVEGISVKELCERFPNKWKYPNLVRKVISLEESFLKWFQNERSSSPKAAGQHLA